MTSSSTAIVPWIPTEGRERIQPSCLEARPGEPQDARRWPAMKKWLMAGSLALAVGATIAGSLWLGLAAVLPLLYVLPCLAMLAMCMKGMNRGGPERSADT